MTGQNQNIPDPGYAITLKDIYRETMSTLRWQATQGYVNLANISVENLAKAIQNCIRISQEAAQACADPRNFTMSQELHLLQTALCDGVNIIESVGQVSSEDWAKMAEKWSAQVREKFGIVNVTPEQTAETQAQLDQFAKDTGQIPASSEETHEDEESASIVPFGGN